MSDGNNLVEKHKKLLLRERRLSGVHMQLGQMIRLQAWI
jgi:hypothetical protein